MSKIRVMDAHLANMIAAGEVVERPSGILKELIENALDANSTIIEIHIEEGGMKHLSVIDNGDGMDATDLVNAFKRHSTSKIFSELDLNQINSFGFRGEALPSIASVSTVMIQTNDGKDGHEILVDNGQQKRLTVFARNKGTTVIVENLFLKVPARLKYIKNTRYETSIISDIINKFAIAHPDVSFRLIDEEKELFRSYGDGNIDNVFYQVFGSSVASNAMKIKERDYDFEIEGVFAQPEHTRAARHFIWLYINDRMIRHSVISNAIIEGFRRHIPNDRFPIGVLKINVDPQLVDVNVHPSKWEIRLSKDRELVALILNSLEDKLTHKTRIPKVKILDEQASMMEELLKEPVLEKTESIIIEKPVSLVEVTKSDEIPFEEKVQDESIFIDNTFKSEPVLEETKESPQKDAIYIEEEIQATEAIESSIIEPLTVLSQMSGKYILAKGETGLYIIDQHAAMERVRYEYYQDKLLNKQVDSQVLLMPLIFDGRSSLVHREDTVKDAFKMFQMDLDVFDESSFILREVPLWIKEKELLEFVNKTLDYLETHRTIREEDFRSDTLATLACHSSVRFNAYMSQLEMETLVSQLRAARQPLHCPHGRPTLMVIEEKDILKRFMR